MTVLSTASRPVDGTGQAPLYILPAGYRAPGGCPLEPASGDGDDRSVEYGDR